ncbi:hypothetical protein NPIL_324911 [Nephila pilipes]|uniref:Uncharacterized protein n=1 Tax=Nephila pilipes TaxID=299642 RepID=A0A8X6NTP5_NEPPI|nr:hypothetical protein NPIL_324911 [Nephila pilipes]
MEKDKKQQGSRPANKTRGKRERTVKAQTTEKPMNGKDESTSVVLVEALEMRPTTKSPRMLLGTNCGKANNAVGEQLGETNLPLT